MKKSVFFLSALNLWLRYDKQGLNVKNFYAENSNQIVLSLIKVHFILNLKNRSPFKSTEMDYLVLCCLPEANSRDFNQVLL